jgi:hypothetical protein
MRTRRLALRREALAELSTGDLSRVAGGALPAPLTLQVKDCLLRTIEPTWNPGACGGPPGSQVQCANG